jgi:hypothetical protein
MLSTFFYLLCDLNSVVQHKVHEGIEPGEDSFHLHRKE